MDWYLKLSTSFNAHWIFPVVLLVATSVVLTSWTVSDDWQNMNYHTCRVLVFFSLGCYLLVFSDLTTQHIQAKVEAIRQNGVRLWMRTSQVAPAATESVTISAITPSHQQQVSSCI